MLLVMLAYRRSWKLLVDHALGATDLVVRRWQITTSGRHQTVWAHVLSLNSLSQDSLIWLVVVDVAAGVHENWVPTKTSYCLSKWVFESGSVGAWGLQIATLSSCHLLVVHVRVVQLRRSTTWKHRGRSHWILNHWVVWAAAHDSDGCTMSSSSIYVAFGFLMIDAYNVVVLNRVWNNMIASLRSPVLRRHHARLAHLWVRVRGSLWEGGGSCLCLQKAKGMIWLATSRFILGLHSF